jgi:hypothetical protein
MSHVSCLFLRPPSLDIVRLINRYPAEGIRRANPRNGTVVAIITAVMAYLKVEGTVSERGASCHAFGTSYAELLIDHVFVIGIFNVLALDSCSGAELVFRRRTPGIGIRFQISPAKITIAA